MEKLYGGSSKTENRTTTWKKAKALIRYIHLYVHCSIIYNSQDVEATKLPINTWMDKDDEACVCVCVCVCV